MFHIGVVTSSWTPYLNFMKIDVISDTVCPWCFIGKRKLEQAMRERSDLPFDVHWHPFQLHPDMPKEGADRKEFVAKKFGSVERARELYQNVADAGQTVGLEFGFNKIERSPNTLDSHRVILWAAGAGLQDEVVEILFRKFFMEGKDLGDHQTLIDAADEAGMDGKIVGDLLKSDRDLDRVTAEESQAREIGVQGVPFFIINDKYALSGAQDASVFQEVFQKIEEEEKAEAAASPSE